MFHLRSCKICFLKKKNPTCFSSYRMVFKPIHQMHQWSFQQPQTVVGGGDQTGLDFLVVYEPCPTDQRKTRDVGGGPKLVSQNIFSPNLDLVEKPKKLHLQKQIK